MEILEVLEQANAVLEPVGNIALMGVLKLLYDHETRLNRVELIQKIKCGVDDDAD